MNFSIRPGRSERESRSSLRLTRDQRVRKVFPVRPALICLLSCFCFFWQASANKGSAAVAFVLYDAGETNALEPVIDLLESKKKSYLVLAMGTAKDVLRQKSQQIDLNKDCKVKAEVDREHWLREALLSEADLKKAISCFNAKLIVTGTQSNVQLQIAQKFRDRGTAVYAFFDGRAPPKKGMIDFSFLNIASKFLVISREIAEATRKLNPGNAVEAVGQPTFELWAKARNAYSPDQVLAKVGKLDHKRPIILYAGGYGPKYEEAFVLFAKATKELSNLNVIVSLHPKVDGELEKRVLKKHGSPHVRILAKEVSTMEAAMIAKLVVSQRSSVGMQALFSDLPVLYLDVPNTDYIDIAIANKWAKQLTSVKPFVVEVTRILGQSSGMSGGFYERAGIPRDSAKLIYDMIESALAPP